MVRDLMTRELNNKNSPYISTPLSVRRGVRETPLSIYEPDAYHYTTPTPLYHSEESLSEWSAASHVEVRQRENSSNRQAVALSLRRGEYSGLVSMEEGVQRERAYSEVHSENVVRSECGAGGGKRVRVCEQTSECELLVRSTESVIKSPARRRKVCVAVRCQMM